jgi:predicted O-linked N-acetylglucosamine transferase (SPINDLY family)
MSEPSHSDQAQLQELAQALADNQQPQAAALAFSLAASGALPVIELFGVAGQLTQAGQAARAIALYRLWLRRSESPLLYAGWYNLAVLLCQANQLASSEQALHKCLALRDSFAEARILLGTVQERLQRPQAALASWRKAIELLDPALPNARQLQLQTLNHLGRLYLQSGLRAAAADACTRSLLLEPQQPPVLAQWLALRQQLCQWPVVQALPGVSRKALQQAITPLALLAIDDDPARQLAAAQRQAESQWPARAVVLADDDGYVHRRLRIGYLGSQLAAVAALAALHDRQRFEVYGFSYGALPAGQTAFDHLLLLDTHSDVQAAQCIRAHDIDVLVDLDGLAASAHPQILTQRPAPVQIGWPGRYPGSSALAAIDYLLSDRHTLPKALQPHVSETPLYLCMPLPSLSPAEDAPASALPPAGAGMVFCSLSDIDKLTPTVFACWMRILLRVPDSVLCLHTDTEQVRDNLRIAALQQGVASERLLFGLARPPAHLCLDTYPYSASAHALAAGLPLLTCRGRSLASRTAAGRLHQAGLTTLIASNLTQYEERAVQLAQDPAQLAALRLQLQQLPASLNAPARLVRALERAYRKVARGVQLPLARSTPQDSSLPLVSLLLPATDADAMENTLQTALAQSYGHLEIVLCDASVDGSCRQRALPFLQADSRLRYVRAPAGSDPLDHSLALALGEYVACTPQGELLAPTRIAGMMQGFLHHPTLALVAALRQPFNADGQPLPVAPVLPSDSLLQGAALAKLLLAGGAPEVTQPAALLLRRSCLGPTFGSYRGRRYQTLAGLAAALSALAHGPGMYLQQALASFTSAPVPADSFTQAQEGLQMLYDAADVVAEPAHYKALLAARLTAFGALVAAQHARLAPQQALIQQTIQQGYRLLLDS